MSARGDAGTQGTAPSAPPPQILLCFYNLWLEAELHSILSCAAVAVVQRGSRNNCVPCRGRRNCWNKLLSPPTPHPQNTYACTHAAAFLSPPTDSDSSLWGFCLLETTKSMRFTSVIIVSQDITHSGSAEWNPLGQLLEPPWAAPVFFSFVPPFNWYWMASQRGTGSIAVGATLNHSLDRIGSRDSLQQLQF